MLKDTKHALDNITEGLAGTLDSVTTGVAHSLDKLTDALANKMHELEKGLANFLTDLFSGDKDREPTDAEKVDAAAKIKTWQELETDGEKRSTLGEAAELIQGQFSAGDRTGHETDPMQHNQERELERVIVVPQYIRDQPGYDATLSRQRELVAQELARNYQGMRNEARMEAYAAEDKISNREQQHEAAQDPATPGIEPDQFDPYAQAAKELNAKPMEQGQEVEGEVIGVAMVNGENYYLVEQDGERLAVPAGDKPEHEMGDEIAVERTKEGFETSASHGYGR